MHDKIIEQFESCMKQLQHGWSNPKHYTSSMKMAETLEEGQVSDGFLERLIRAQVQYSALQLQRRGSNMR